MNDDRAPQPKRSVRRPPDWNEEMQNYNNVEEQVEYGLESSDPNRRIEVPLRDLMYAYQTIGHAAESGQPVVDD